MIERTPMHARHSRLGPVSTALVEAFPWLWQRTAAKGRRQYLPGVIRMSPRDAALLSVAASDTEGDVLEIGRAQGGSALVLAHTLKGTGRRVLSVDIEDVEDARATLALDDYGQACCRVTVDSLRYEPPSDYDFGLMLVDGSHTMEGVVGDLRQHWHRMRMGAVVIFHGGNIHPPVTEVLGELLDLGCAQVWGFVDVSVAVTKTGELPAGFMAHVAEGEL